MAKSVIAQELLQKYADYIKQDYFKWSTCGDPSNISPIRQKMIDEFEVTFEPGSSYIRVVHSSGSSRSSHSFIVVKDGKFPVGTILKSASWKAPATNFARGNVLTGDFKRIRWTGAL